MKSLIGLIIKLAVAVLIIYGLVFAVYRTGEDEIIILKELKDNSIVQVYSGQVNFIWQGMLAWRYRVSKVTVRGSAILQIKAGIPSLSSLVDDAYIIRIPVNITYQIDKKLLPDMRYLGSRQDIENFIADKMSLISSTVLSRYIDPVYDRTVIKNNEKLILNSLAAEITNKFTDIGIKVSKVEFLSTGYFPENKIYAEGLAQNKEMRDLDFSNRKQEILLAKKLLKEKYENELYYEKLLRISTLLKGNPDILKFIYIDKLGDDVRVIISSDKSGLPAMFNEGSDAVKPGKKGDVDNLR